MKPCLNIVVIVVVVSNVVIVTMIPVFSSEMFSSKWVADDSQLLENNI